MYDACNPLLRTDSYKFSHWLQYPPGTEETFFYVEARDYDAQLFPEGMVPSGTVFFGLQMFLKECLSLPILEVDIEDAAELAEEHGEPFNKTGWKWIVDNCKGYLPLKIRAVPEGFVVPLHNVLATVEATAPEAFWLPSWIETQVVRAIWYGTTVATISWHAKKVILENLLKTSDDPFSEIDFKLHDFGARGVSSGSSAGMGGAAHLVNFLGSDTLEGVEALNRYYAAYTLPAFSIPAAEHSTITAWGREHQVDAYRNMLKQFAKPGKMVAVVSDSYDIFEAVRDIWCGTLLEEVKASGATVVIRPDSGDPTETVLKILKIMEQSIGFETNTKGYKVLPPYFRLIQGDGVNLNSIKKILEAMRLEGYSGSNIAFGMGGALLQKVNRDTFHFAYKLSWAKVNGVGRDCCKSPVDQPLKKSKSGRLSLAYSGPEFLEFRTVQEEEHHMSVLQDAYYYAPGSVAPTLRDISLQQIRLSAGHALKRELGVS